MRFDQAQIYFRNRLNFLFNQPLHMLLTRRVPNRLPRGHSSGINGLTVRLKRG